MGSKQRGSKIKKSRLMLILKSRKITITKMAEDLGYNRKSMSRAINVQYMDDKTLGDIARYLDVSPDFITGKTKLLKLKDGKRSEFNDSFDADMLDSSGYLIPSYSDYQLTKSIEKYNATPLSVRVPEYGYIQQAFSELGKNGVYDGETKDRKFDDDFIKKHFNYLVVETYSFMKDQVISIWKNDKKYNDYLAFDEMMEESTMQQIDHFDSLFEVIEEAEDPEGDNNA